MRGKISLIETIVGIFILTATAGLVITISVKSKQLGWFETESIFRIRLEASGGIEKNTEVLVNGIPAGYVTDIEIDKDTSVIVSMLIRERFAGSITSKAVVEVTPPAFGFGSTVINILPGPGGLPLETGAMLKVLEAPESIMKKAEGLTGTANKALVSGDELFRTMKDLATEWLVIFREYNRQEGVIFRTMTAVEESIRELRATNAVLQKDLQELEGGLQSVKAFARDAADVSAEFRRGEGGLAALLNNTTAFTRDLGPAGKNITKITDEVLGLVDKTSKTMDQFAASRATLEAITASLKGTLVNVESITGKIDRGEGALGQFVNDDDIYVKVEDAVDTTANLIKSLNQVRTWVRMQDAYYSGLGVNMVSIGMRIEPRPSRYFYVGGTFIRPIGETDVTTENKDIKLFPDALVAQRIFDNRITIKVGLIEGKVGAGVAWDIFDRRTADTDLTVSKLTLELEGRDFYGDDDLVTYDENVDDFIIRTRIEYKFAKYFFLSVGADNLLNNAGYAVSLGFEYIDRDIATVVGLMNMK